MYHLRLTLSAVVGRMSETRSYWRRRRAHSASSRPCDETNISRCGLRLIYFPIISSKGIKHHKVPFFTLHFLDYNSKWGKRSKGEMVMASTATGSDSPWLEYTTWIQIDGMWVGVRVAFWSWVPLFLLVLTPLHSWLSRAVHPPLWTLYLPNGPTKMF